MSEQSTLEIASQYGFAGFFALVVGWIIYRIGLRMIAAIDKLIERISKLSDDLRDRVDEHTRVDVEYHAEVQTELAALRSRFDTVFDLTPVEGRRPIRPQTPGKGSPVPDGEYAVHNPRARSRGDRDR